MSDLQDEPDDLPDAAPSDLRGLRFLRGLVTLLTATMIVGIVAMVVLLYTRLPAPTSGVPSALPALPDNIVLPDGARAQAITAGPGWWAVVTDAGAIHLFDQSGALMRTIAAEELSR